MKTIRNSFFTLLICMIYSFGYAQKATNQKIKNIVDVTIEKLHNEVQLTDSQKVKLREYTTSYFTQIDSANQLTDEQEKRTIRKEIFDNYNSFCDSLLTTAQLEQKQAKLELRKDNATKKGNK